MSIGERLDLDLAWKRVKDDFKQESFYSYPYLESIIDSDCTNWLNSLKESIITDKYRPSSSELFDIPKKDWHIRPGGILLPVDSVVYSALLLDAFKPIYDKLSWSAKRYRFSNILRQTQDNHGWFEFNMNNWTEQRNVTIKYAEDSKFVVKFDISGFFENIEIHRLLSDLNDIGVPNDNIKLLSKCLKRWSNSGRKGLLQGFSPSQILAEVYLDEIDERLENENARFLRYSDDGHIFTRSKGTAIEALHMLTRLLRDKGLNLQTAKTRIVESHELLEEFKVIPDLIESANDKVRSVASELAGYQWNYLWPKQLKRLFDKIGKTVKIDALRQAFDDKICPDVIGFDKTLFHFILHRFAVAGDDYALSFCLDLFTVRPEETKAILEHLDNFIITHEKMIVDKIVEVLSPTSILLDYQRYLIVKLLFEKGTHSRELLQVIRKNLSIRDLKVWVRDYLLAYLGLFGNRGDLDKIKEYYNSGNSVYSNTTVICALKKLQISRRNSFYSEVSGDHGLIKTAVNWVKSQSS